ncbi:MAG: aminotransferase class V-fold PLP-dependent enzyme [Chitinophagaceae bacterium]|nr:aminotransferase class V-fold PLP-dependent enzyme [Chitinophagaceae bacterium]
MDYLRPIIKTMTEAYFKPFRDQVIGIDQHFPTPLGEKKMIYADWIASGRLYQPIEQTLNQKVFPFCANTHTETSITGTLMTRAYQEAKRYIKQEVNANEDDALIFCGSGMTDAINKLQRMMGLRIPERAEQFAHISKQVENARKPIVFITHLEHHSNHTSWLETLADVEIINPDENGEVDLNHFAQLIVQYQDRPLKIASVSACSNVTGIFTPYETIAEMIHQAGGYCFVDFACSGPYVDMNMHPENPLRQLDVIFISPHKFLGGPGTPGIMVMNKKIYHNTIPDNSGGGTVKFTTPWKFHEYVDDIESREDGGTPPFLQGIKAALCFKLKREMGVPNILAREKVLLNRVMDELEKIPNLHVMAGHNRNRIGAISFYIDGLHFNSGVKLLNDYYGIQVRGGCSCAGTYGHYLLNIDQQESDRIWGELKKGNIYERPGWIRLSIHPIMSDEDVETILDGIRSVAANFEEMEKLYTYNPKKNIYKRNDHDETFETDFIDSVFAQPF